MVLDGCPIVHTSSRCWSYANACKIACDSNQDQAGLQWAGAACAATWRSTETDRTLSRYNISVNTSLLTSCCEDLSGTAVLACFGAHRV